jgi:hypothetical protein
VERDALLQAAYLDGVAAVAGKWGAAVCVGRKSLGGIPLMELVFLWETRKRLRALKAFLKRNRNQ